MRAAPAVRTVDRNQSGAGKSRHKAPPECQSASIFLANYEEQDFFYCFFFALTTQMKSFDIRTFFLLNFLIPKPVGILAATLHMSKDLFADQ